MTAWKITIWCDTPDDVPEHDLAMYLEQGEMWERFPGSQYQIEQVTSA